MINTKFSRAAKTLLAAAMLIGVATVGQAHHSFAAQYDSNKPTSLEGVVTKVEWTDPHVYIYIDVTDAKTLIGLLWWQRWQAGAWPLEWRHVGG